MMRTMSNVVRIKRISNKALVLALAQLLQEAQSGELESFAYIARDRRGHCSADSIGPTGHCHGMALALVARTFIKPTS